MKVNLWVLVDIGGRILYTGYSKELVENAKNEASYANTDLYVIELKGEVNV
jgi:hypothetical protein